jgi:FecR protein
MTEPLRPNVEPLPDVAWGRIERGLWDRMDHGIAIQPRRPWWVVAPILAVAAAIALWLGLRSHNANPVDDGSARIVAGATPSSASFGDAYVEVDSNSALDILYQGDAPTALVEYGAVWFSVAPRGTRPPFEVRAGDAIVRVIGTRFRVAREGERVDVLVDRGIVEVRFRGAVATLKEHQSWSSTKPSEIVSTATETHVPPVVATPDIVPTPTPSIPSHVDIDRTRYEELQRIEAKRPDLAMTGYLELSKGSSKWAQIALFAAGRLAVDRHDPRARSLLSIYLTRFQQGANAADARQLLERLDGGAR